MAISAAVLKKISLKGINPHLLGAGGVAGGLFALALALMLFGNPDDASGARVMAMPPLSVEAAHAPVLAEQLRADNEPVAGAPISDTGHADEPVLPGLEDPDSAPAPHHSAPASHAPVSHAAPRARPGALVPAPVKALTAPGPGGVLPVIGPDGRRPADVYARPLKHALTRPGIALVIGGLGLKKTTTLEAINTLPPQVTLSFVPYTAHLQDWIDRARAAGHEVMIELPMEPFDYPQNDPGPQTLLSTASSAENTRRLEWLLSRASGYFAVTNYMGSKFTASEAALAPVLRQLRQRGIDFVYDGETRRSSLRRVAEAQHLRWTVADRIIDAEPSPAAIDEQLLNLEALAIQNGTALGVGFSWPVTMRRVQSWTATLEQKGYMLIPASAVVRARNPAVNIATIKAGGHKLAANKRH